MEYNFYLLGIDPGNNTGIAIFEISALTLCIVNITTATVVLNDIASPNLPLGLGRNVMLNKVCDRLACEYQPNVVAMEAAFLNVRFPKAVMQLSQYVSTIENTFYNNNNFVKLYKHPPKYVKKYIGGGGNADKDAMLLAVKAIPEVFENINLDRVTEHEVDAIAIGYVTLAMLRQYPHLLISY